MKEILIILACVPFYAANAFCDKLASTKMARVRMHFIMR